MLGLTTFLQRSTTSLNQISSFGKKLLNTYAYMTNAVKNSYSFYDSLKSANESAVELLQLTPKLESFLQYWCHGKMSNFHKSISLSTVSLNGKVQAENFKQESVTVEQKSYGNDTGVLHEIRFNL